MRNELQEAIEYFETYSKEYQPVSNSVPKYILDDLNEHTQLYRTALSALRDALRGPEPDPDTGLVPCGCGGKVDVAFYPGWHGVPDKYQVDCFYCHVGTRPCQTAEQAKASWNTAMGWRVEE